MYSTKSSYSWLILKKVGYGSYRLFWRLIWKLNVPLRFVFSCGGWAIIFLPTNVKVASIHHGVSSASTRCNMVKEMLVHALRDCVKVREVLLLGKIDGRLLMVEWSKDINWLESVMMLVDRRAFECLIMLLWNIWNSRSKFLFRSLSEASRLV